MGSPSRIYYNRELVPTQRNICRIGDIGAVGEPSGASERRTAMKLGESCCPPTSDAQAHSVREVCRQCKEGQKEWECRLPHGKVDQLCNTKPWRQGGSGRQEGTSTSFVQRGRRCSPRSARVDAQFNFCDVCSSQLCMAVSYATLACTASGIYDSADVPWNILKIPGFLSDGYSRRGGGRYSAKQTPTACNRSLERLLDCDRYLVPNYRPSLVRPSL